MRNLTENSKSEVKTITDKFEIRSSGDKAANSDTVDDIGQLISDMELSQLRLELKISNKEMERLKCEVKTITDKLENLTSELNEIYEKESDAQLEITILKSELHRATLKTAAAEASEVRAKCENSRLKFANQQLGLEAEEAKRELQLLKGLAHKANDGTQNLDIIDIDDTITEEQRSACISISIKEYEALLTKADKAVNPEVANREIDVLKREIEITKARIGEFRTRAEQAVWRAEVAEKANALFEQERRKWREHEERRKVDFTQQSISLKNTSFRKYHESPKIYMPLGRLLKMKF